MLGALRLIGVCEKRAGWKGVYLGLSVELTLNSDLKNERSKEQEESGPDEGLQSWDRAGQDRTATGVQTDNLGSRPVSATYQPGGPDLPGSPDTKKEKNHLSLCLWVIARTR